MANTCPSLLQGVRARLQEQISGIVQVVCQLDDKDGASSTDLEDLASQTQVQVNEIAAAVSENLQQVERHLQAEHDDSVLRDACKEVGNQITEFTSGLQLIQHAQEGREWQQLDAMASVLQDVQRTSLEVHDLRSDLARHIDRFSIALDAKDRIDLHCKDLRAQLAAKQTGFEGFLSFCSTGVELLAQELHKDCEHHEESLRRVCRGEIDGLDRLFGVQSSLRQIFRELRGAVINDMASQQSEMASLRADLHNYCIRTEAAETSHAGLMKTLSEVVQWHRQELYECRQEVEDTQAKVDALVDDLAVSTASACALSEQKQQAEASLTACREYIAYLQEATEQEDSHSESDKSVHEHLLMESQSQIDHFKAAFEASDSQMQAAQRQNAAHVGEIAVLQAEQEALAALIQQQREVIGEQSAQTDRDRETIACLEVCMHSAIEEMELMCTTSTSTMQSLRETPMPTIAAELKSTQQQLTDLRCFVQKSIIHMQDTKRLLYHHMEDKDELSFQNEVQNLSAELLHSRQSGDGWRERYNIQVKETDRVKEEYKSHMQAQSLAAQALQEEICNLKVAIAYAEEHHRNVLAHAALQADRFLAAGLEDAQAEFESQQIQATEQLTRDLQDNNKRETQAWQAMIQEKHTREVQALEAVLAHEKQCHAASLDDLVGRHEQMCAVLRQQAHDETMSLRQQHEEALSNLIQQHSQSSQAAATAFDGRLQSALAQAEEKYTRQLAAQQLSHEQQLATAHAVAERHVQETIAKWRQHCYAEKEAAHAVKMDELAELSKSQAVAMAQCQGRHAEEVAALEASVKRLQDCTVQQRTAAESQQASHASMMAQALHDLDSKDTAMDLAAEQHREELARNTAEAEGRMQTLAVEHANHMEDMQKLHKSAMLEQQIEAEAGMEELNDQLTALKQRFDARESRREDVDKIRHLAQAVADRDASISELHADLGKMESKLQQLHREMILRDDNYTKTFANGGAGMRVPDVRQALNTQQTAVDWMIKQPPSQSKRISRK